MNGLWGTVVSVAAAVVIGAVASSLNDEVRGRLDRLPRAILALAGRRLPPQVREDLTDEWAAELEAILKQAEGLPLTRLMAGIRYSSGLWRTAPIVAYELTGVPARSLPPRAWAYVAGVITVAGGLIASSSFAKVEWGTLAVLAMLFLVCDSAPAKLNVERARVSLGYAASLASVVLLGPVGAALVGATAIVTGQRFFAPVKRLFNGAQFALSGYAAGVVFQVLNDDRHRLGQANWLEHAIWPFLAALVTFVAVNLLLMAGILLLTNTATWRELLGESSVLAVGCLGYGMFGLLIAGLWDAVGAFSPVLVLLPLFIARWAFAQAHARTATAARPRS